MCLHFNFAIRFANILYITFVLFKTPTFGFMDEFYVSLLSDYFLCLYFPFFCFFFFYLSEWALN